jgi:hypothetical protein
LLKYRRRGIDKRTKIVIFFTSWPHNSNQDGLPLFRNVYKSLLLSLLAWLSLSGPARSQEGNSTDSTESDNLNAYYIIETRHRLYPDFVQIDTVRPGQPFLIGEDEYRAEVMTFNPHLGITTDGEYLKVSDTLRNPAVRIRVLDGEEEMQKSWAFHFVSAPHYYRQELLGFKLLEFKVSDEYIPIPKTE